MYKDQGEDDVEEPDVAELVGSFPCEDRSCRLEDGLLV